ncbi:hypothetical protein NT06LI_2012, partial [Listeria innocua FSL J1-023]
MFLVFVINFFFSRRFTIPEIVGLSISSIFAISTALL